MTEPGTVLDIAARPEDIVAVIADFESYPEWVDSISSATVLTTGESGLPGSSHYDDMVDPWVTGRYLPLPFSRSAVETARTGETRLDPAG